MSEFKFEAVVEEGTSEYIDIQVSIRVLSPVVDRPIAGGWGFDDTPGNRKLVSRLVKAINDGVAVSSPEVKTDKFGKTYVGWDYGVIGRRMSADLKRLGY